MTKLPKTIAYKGYDIPTGKTPADLKKRKEIITHFYKTWGGSPVERKVRNNELKRFIHVNEKSVDETRYWACLSAQSTLTVLELTYVLKHAVKVDENPANPNKKSQKDLEKMLVMECVVPSLRPYVKTAKLTVGVIKQVGRKRQYCLTAKENGR